MLGDMYQMSYTSCAHKDMVYIIKIMHSTIFEERILCQKILKL